MAFAGLEENWAMLGWGSGILLTGVWLRVLQAQNF